MKLVGKRTYNSIFCCETKQEMITHTSIHAKPDETIISISIHRITNMKAR